MGALFSHPPMLPQSVPPGSTGQSLDKGYHQVAHYTNPVTFAEDEVLKSKTTELKSLISSFEKKEKAYAKKVKDLANRAKDVQNRQLEVMFIVGCLTDWCAASGNLDIKQQLDNFDQKPYLYAEVATTIASTVIGIVAMFVPGGAIVAVVVPMIGAAISDGIQIKEVEDRIDQVNEDSKKLASTIASHESKISSLNSKIDQLNKDLDAFDQRAFQVLNVKSWEDFKNNETYSGIFKVNVTDMKSISTTADALKAASAIGNGAERAEFMKLFKAKTKLAGQIGEINASIQKTSVTSRSLPFVTRLAATPKVGLAEKSDEVTAEEDKIINSKFKAAMLKMFNVSRPQTIAIFSAAEILRMLAVSHSAVDASQLEKSLDTMIPSIYSMKKEFDNFSNNWAYVAGQEYSKMYNDLEALEKVCASTQEQFLEPLLELLHFLFSTKHAWKWDEKTNAAFEGNIIAVGSGAHKSEIESLIRNALPQLESDMHHLMADIVTDSVPLPEQVMAMA